MNNESSGWAKVDLSGQIISFEIDKPKISFEFNQFRLKYYDLNAYKNSSWFYYLSGFNQDKYFIYLMELYLMIMKNIQYVFIFQIIDLAGQFFIFDIAAAGKQLCHTENIIWPIPFFNRKERITSDNKEKFIIRIFCGQSC